MTGSIKQAMAETDRRRKIQLAYNKKHGITPKSIQKAITHDIELVSYAKRIVHIKDGKIEKEVLNGRRKNEK